MILMPILLMNLLIGLAVGDIESVRRNAQLKRLAMQVSLNQNGKVKIKFFELFFERLFCILNWRGNYRKCGYIKLIKWN